MFTLGLLPSSLLLTSLALSAEPAPVCRPAGPVQRMLQRVQEHGNPLDALNAGNAAKLWEQREIGARATLRKIPLAKITDTFVPARNRQIPLRLYRPAARPGEKLPVLVYFHGGGWTLGSLAAYDSLLRALARSVPALVVSVDYRLAPEHPYPAAVDDAYLALEWAARNAEEYGGDPERLAVAGDSAGGNLATVAARRAARHGLRLAGQALFYPSVDIARTDTKSFAELGEGYLLTRRAVEAFQSFYLPDAGRRTEPDASPLRAPAPELAKLPPTLLVLAGCDPLRDEQLAYAEKLKAAGVPLTVRAEEGMVHGYLNFFNGASDPALSAATEPLVEEAAAAVGRLLRESAGPGPSTRPVVPLRTKKR